jgi:hypothetical protein
VRWCRAARHRSPDVVVLVEFVHIRPSEVRRSWDDLEAALQGASMAAVLLDGPVDEKTLIGAARVIALSNVGVVAAHGKLSKYFENLINHIAVADHRSHLITTAESDTLEIFMLNVTFTWRGLLGVPDQYRCTLFCYISDEPVPKELSTEIERMRSRVL